jgi:hypothetical protein
MSALGVALNNIKGVVSISLPLLFCQALVILSHVGLLHSAKITTLLSTS